jgi:hypothetical protein
MKIRWLSAVCTFAVVLRIACAHAAAVSSGIEGGAPAHTCVPITTEDASHSPIALYRSMGDCATAGRYEDAIDYFAVAGVFGRYDAYRVADTTSHQIVSVIKSAALDAIPPTERAEFQKLASASYNDPAEHSALCDRVRSIGKPTYFPTYMIAHGLDNTVATLKGEADSAALVSPFDPDSAWLKAMSTYLGCH